MRIALAGAAVFVGFCLGQSVPVREPPFYSAATVLNSASGLPDSIAPNSVIAIHGSNLAWITSKLEDGATSVPTVLPSTGVRVTIRNQGAGILAVSPDQILALVPPTVAAGAGTLICSLDGVNGPEVPVVIRSAAPGFFLREEGWVAASTGDGSEVSRGLPARVGDEVVLFGTGLGTVHAQSDTMSVPQKTAALLLPYSVLLNGSAVDAGALRYAGLYPGLPGIYQIRFRVPDDSPPDPEIRINVDGNLSAEGVRIPVTYP